MSPFQPLKYAVYVDDTERPSPGQSQVCWAPALTLDSKVPRIRDFSKGDKELAETTSLLNRKSGESWNYPGDRSW